MSYKNPLSLTAVLLGVFLIGIGFYQVNQYMSAVSLADSAKSLALGQLDDAVAGLGLSPEEAALYKQELQSQIDVGSQAYYSLADSLVPSILLDFVLGGILLLAGILFWPTETRKR